MQECKLQFGWEIGVDAVLSKLPMVLNMVLLQENINN